MILVRTSPARWSTCLGSCIALLLLQGGCTGWREQFQQTEIPRLKDRASFDLKCPKEQLTATELDSIKAQGVSGCGKKATYVMASSGTWVKNSQE